MSAAKQPAAEAPTPVGVLAGEAFDADYASLTARLEREAVAAIAELERSKAEQLAAPVAKREAEQLELQTELFRFWNERIAHAVSHWEINPNRVTAAEVSRVIRNAEADVRERLAFKVKTRIKVKRRLPEGNTTGQEFFYNEESAFVWEAVEFCSVRKVSTRPVEGARHAREPYDTEPEVPNACRAVRLAFGATGEKHDGDPWAHWGVAHAEATDRNLLNALDNGVKMHRVLETYQLAFSEEGAE